MTRSSRRARVHANPDSVSARKRAASDKPRRSDVRNVAIIAHVDHGKTTLVDALIHTCKVFRDNQQIHECLLDSNDQERERGITIFAKNIALNWRGVKLNIVDTPGHADFGGEVERIMSMVDGCLLLVDAFEGVMPQTRFVLKKAFQHGHHVLVVVNKVDRPGARPEATLDEVFDLFCDLEASEDQLEFPYIFCSGRDRYTVEQPGGPKLGMDRLLDMILEKIPGPVVDEAAPFRFQVSNIQYDNYMGRIAIGRIHSGAVTLQTPIAIARPNGPVRAGVMKRLQMFENLGRIDVPKAKSGDIIAILGINEINIGDTICHADSPDPLPVTAIDEPTMSLVFQVNDGPLAGKSGGQFLTSRHIKERLQREAISNVALKVEEGPTAETTKVSGRGVMHIGVLIETMRREGYEFCVSRPEVIIKRVDGKLVEPIEKLVVNVSETMAGKVLELVGQRRGEMQDMKQRGSLQTLTFLIPARGLIGLRTRMLNATSGEAAMYHTFHGWEPYRGDIPGRSRGVMVAIENDVAVAYALNNLKDRGVLFVKPGDPCYEGMIVGEHSRTDDIDVNVSKRKHLTNMRSAGADDLVVLPTPRSYSVEEALEYIADDELVEFTPESIRLRKKILKDSDRRKARRSLVKVDAE